jgi:protein required for attachment to host cells
MKTWVVVAQRDGARVYEWASHHVPLVLREVLRHPEGRLRDSEIDSDGPGAKVDSVAPGGGSAAWKEVGPTEHLADVFAAEVARHIEKGRLAHAFERLVLVSGPRFLGRMRAAIGESMHGLEVREVHLNLGHADVESLQRHLEHDLGAPALG